MFTSPVRKVKTKLFLAVSASAQKSSDVNTLNSSAHFTVTGQKLFSPNAENTKTSQSDLQKQKRRGNIHHPFNTVKLCSKSLISS